MRKPRPAYRHQCEIRLRVAFYDTDPMGVVWHGNYLKFFEQAREALLRQYRYDYSRMQESGCIWPVVESYAKYRHPVRFGEQISVRAFILEFENRLKIGYEVCREGGAQLCCHGHTVQLAVDAASGEVQMVCPASLFEALGEPCPWP